MQESYNTPIIIQNILFPVKKSIRVTSKTKLVHNVKLSKTIEVLELVIE